MAMRKIATMLLLISLSFVFAENLLVNPGMEDQTLAFWTPLNGTFGTDVGVTDAAMAYAGFHSFMITKAAASANMVGWESVNNADLYWNNAAVATYTLKAQIKLAGVNTAPANDDAKIGVMYEFLDGSGNVLVAENIWADQTAADADWTEFSSVVILTAEPAEVTAKLIMGKDATGTAYFDNVACGSDPWSMGLFNGNAETVTGWLSWYASDNGSYGTVTMNDAHSGDYAQELYKPDTTSSTSEIVYYSIPAPVTAGELYKIGFWAKTVGVNDSSAFEASYILKDRLDDRLGITYFFHTDDPIDSGWSLSGGDKFVYVDQTTTDTEWTHYTVIERAPEDATGISVRSRYTSNPTGLTYFDDFSVERMAETGDEIMGNAGLEDQMPNFWTPLNGTFGTDVGVTDAAASYSGMHSFMITKAAASANMVGWQSANNADLYWNNAAIATYTIGGWVKLAGVNTAPANDDAKIGLMFEFLDASGNVLVAENLWADQTNADADWAELTSVTILTAEPAEVNVKMVMGKDATGTVYFDNVGCGSDPWSMGLFNGNAETINGWLNWYASDNGSYGTVTMNDAHSGDYSQELFKPDTTSSTSEIVYYSIPYPVEAGEWYKVGFWAKTVGVNDSSAYEPSYIRKDRDDGRIGITYFFHTDDPINSGWSLSGGDKFVYIDQTTTDTDWTFYEVAEQAPEDATGISVRARYTSNPTGLTYFDDYTVQKLAARPVVSIDDDYHMTQTPDVYQLSQNYPNPFNPTTKIEFTTPVDGIVSLDIYNVLGQKIKTLYSGQTSAGHHSVTWDATNASGEAMSTGVYIYMLSGVNGQVSQKMVLIR